ncbi:TetR/AcrR family transcriptional regulator [Sciscionella marina]|uniref:TetR/AcrR family transcriptional regulator n=1 Tax=Sciscionella marina TaxID=508770 RepID=UPI0023E0BFD1|nr:TetR/AcrR family transcriptional regulator [Sciscionella marina]
MVTVDSTEGRLIEAAERLFAEHGVGAVSLRAIMQAAGTNVAAVHYHFGSKQALLDAVLRTRIDQVARERETLLRELSNAEVTVEDLADAYVRPLVAVLGSGGEFWIRLVDRLLAAGDGELGPVAESFLERNAAFLELLGRGNPGIETRTLHFRLIQAMRLTLNVLGDIGHTQRLLGEHGWSTEDVVGHLTAVVTGIFAGPPGQRQPRRTRNGN